MGAVMWTGEMMAGLAEVDRILLAARGAVVAILLSMMKMRSEVGASDFSMVCKMNLQ